MEDYSIKIKLAEEKAKISDALGVGNWCTSAYLAKARIKTVAEKFNKSVFEMNGIRSGLCKEYVEWNSEARANRDFSGGNGFQKYLYGIKYKLIKEQADAEVFEREQEILKKTFETDKSEQQVAQEAAKAKQELAKAKVEAARATAASRLADQGNAEAARTLLGVQEAEGSWKKPVIISGILVGALTVGFGIYKLVK